MKILNRLKIDEIVKALWCGSLWDFEHNFLKHSVNFSVTVKDLNDVSFYRVNIEKINRINITYDNPEIDWDYVELTEIEIEEGENTIIFSSELWSSCLLEIEAGEIEVLRIAKL